MNPPGSSFTEGLKTIDNIRGNKTAYKRSLNNKYVMIKTN